MQREGFLRAKIRKSLRLEARNWNHSLELVIPKLNKLEKRSFWPAVQRSRLDHRVGHDSKSLVFATRPSRSSRLEEPGLRDSTRKVLATRREGSSRPDHRVGIDSSPGQKPICLL
ncbi:hypothetical protein L2E82_04068 [Cichorium intybus]|uniref:Uncharacterized protein n=1 Tax=Cichorium intybus TaxID=13427 RepID=A0ACB9H6H3_CICIN|nr:hypothetical protein L2E82_04068 [Cichorium intybus]